MKLLLTLGALLVSGMVAATPIHNIVVFGDSLSDNGNLYKLMDNKLPKSPPYYQGRFSNGPVWVEKLAAMYYPNDADAHLQDYAFGGAGISEDPEAGALLTLKKELQDYFKDHNDKASADDLYIVWIGANNYLGVPENTEETLHQVNVGLVHGLQELADKGAKHIVVLNLPDLGRTPAAVEFDSVEPLSYFATQHNAALDISMENLKQAYQEVHWMYYDLNKSFTDLLDNPDNYGLTNTQDTCMETEEGVAMKSMLSLAATFNPKLNKKSCDGYLFFDLIHPTAFTHQIMATKAKNYFDSEGLEFISEPRA